MGMNESLLDGAPGASPQDPSKDPGAADTTAGAQSKQWKPPQRSAEELAAIAARAHKRYTDTTGTIDEENRREAVFDFKFTYKPGSQWDEDIKNNERKGRLCLEMNQLPQFVNAVVNDMRQNRAGIRISPEDDAAEAEAKLRQGIIRGIEYQSQADAIYDQGGRDAVVAGRGYWRVLTEYENERSFNQRIVIKAIPDFNSVVLDPEYNEPDGGDRQWGIVLERMDKASFLNTWKKANPLNWDDARSLWTDAAGMVAVADYYERVRDTPRKLLGLSNGMAVYEDELEAGQLEAMVAQGITIVNEREVESWKVHWFKLAGGQQVLAEYEWRGTIVPIVCCIGNEFVIEGKRYFTGLIRWARDAQRMYNFAQSTIGENAALSPKAPYIMAEGQDEGYEADWDQANRRNRSRLLYKPTTYQGHLVPPPQRVPGAVVQPALIDMSNTARGDLRATIGLYDPSLGQRSNETSGRAIMAREQQGDVATFNFPDNQGRAIALTGRICNELLPEVYDAVRQVQTVEPDGKVKPATVNALGGMGGLNKQSQFSIRVEVGPGYATKRQEARESLMSFVQALPESGAILAPLIAKNHDWEGADEVAELLEVLLPPPVQAVLQARRKAKEGGAPPPDPAMLAEMQAKDQQIAEMQQQLGEAQQAVQQAQAGDAAKAAQAQADGATAQAKIAADQQATSAKIAADERAAIAKAESEARIAQARANADAAASIEIARIKAEADKAAKIAAAQAAAEADIAIAEMQERMKMRQLLLAPPTDTPAKGKP